MMHDSNQDSARNSSPTLWIVVPCFNEQEVLPITAPMFLQKMNELIDEGKVSEKSTVCFVDDGSKDDTWEIIQTLPPRRNAARACPCRATEDIKTLFWRD